MKNSRRSSNHLMVVKEERGGCGAGGGVGR